MLAFRINTEYLDFDSDFEMQLDITNPIFSTDAIKGTYSYPIKFPASDKNRRILGHWTPLTKGNLLRKFDVEVLLGNSIFLSGKLYISTPGSDGYEGYVLPAAGEINGETMDQPLSELYMGEDKEMLPEVDRPFLEIRLTGTSVTQISVSIISKVGATSPMDKIATSSSITDDLETTLHTLAREFTNDPSEMERVGLHAVIASGRVITFISDNDQIPTIIGFNATGSDVAWANSTFEPHKVQLHMEEVSKKKWPEVDYTFFPVRWNDFYNEESDIEFFVNFYEYNRFIVPSIGEFASRKCTVIPFVYASAVTKAIFDQVNYRIKGTWKDDPEIQTLVLLNNKALDEPLYDGNGEIIVNRIRRTFNLSEHLPDMTCGEYLTGLRNLFSLGLFFDYARKEVEIISLKDVLSDLTYIDLTSKVQKQFEATQEEANGFTLGYENDSSDLQVSNNFKPVTGLAWASSVATEADLPADDPINTIRVVRESPLFLGTENVVMRMVYESDTVGSKTKVWKFHSFWNPVKTEGDGGNVVSIPFTPVHIAYMEIGWHNYLFSTFPTRISLEKVGITVPHLQQPGTSNLFDTGENQLAPKLLFYRGYHPSSQGTNIANPEPPNDHLTSPGSAYYEYPQATTLPFAHRFFESFNYSLQMDDVEIPNWNSPGDFYYDGTKNIYNVWGKEWLNFLNGPIVVTQTIYIEVSDLLNLNKLLRHKVRVDNATYIIKRIKVGMTANRVKPAKVEMLRL